MREFKRHLIRYVSLVLTILFAGLTALLAIMLLVSLLALATGDMGLLDTLGVFAATMIFALLTAVCMAVRDSVRGEDTHD